MKKVITLDPRSLASQCKRLEAVCPLPDLVVGIADGGVCVSREMFSGVDHAVISKQRSTTPKKQSSRIVRGVRRLPYWVLDFMRVVESWLLQAKQPEISDVVIDQDTTQRMRQARNILIVDDAVDSGATLASVVRAVKAAAKEGASISTATLTVTTKHPVIMPDYTLYNNVLLRFPWSMDYKEKSL